jgi:hypothetical protein
MENFVFVLYLTIIVLNRKEQRQEGRKKKKIKSSCISRFNAIAYVRKWECKDLSMFRRKHGY